ncbi:LysR family transcriptional regulator [Polaromonas sp. SM01]|uniref:LysR family transcriptional regulator n=1 Tax=Polaromonas sp. SM01 TaxID=3085630 RepID=UPI0029827E1D|nr:LysR family transcriptional regulator [Polaromonas sp. SM01]MDW5441969.1 LysR family transcriptional regulator [Polaromonas sp. SM01]
MNLTIREFRVFRAVYELRSFSASAGTMHMTQSAVSKLCQEMEAKVGQRLFERSTRKVEPTLWADHLYGYACEILGTMDAAERTLRSLANLDMGEIDVAASPMMMHGLLTVPLQQLHARHPGIHTGLHELSTDATIDYVINGKADFGLVSMGQTHPGLQIEPLYDEAMYAVYGAEHPLARQTTISWEQVAVYPHISLHPAFSVRRTIDRVYQQKGLSYTSVIEAGTVLSVLGLLKAGLGVAVLPGYIMGFAADLGLLSHRLLAADCAHPISLIRRWNARTSPAAEALIVLLKASLAARA